MKLLLKFNLVFLLVFALGLAATGYVSWALLERNAVPLSGVLPVPSRTPGPGSRVRAPRTLTAAGDRRCPARRG